MLSKKAAALACFYCLLCISIGIDDPLTHRSTFSCAVEQYTKWNPSGELLVTSIVMEFKITNQN